MPLIYLNRSQEEFLSITSHFVFNSLFAQYIFANNLVQKGQLIMPLNRIFLKGPSQPPPFSMPSKLLILHGEVKSECFTIRCVPESTFNYF